MSLRDQLLQIMKPYVGLAAPDMLERTAKTMVGVEQGDLSREHLRSLSYWIRIAAKKVLPEGRADEMADKIQNL